MSLEELMDKVKLSGGRNTKTRAAVMACLLACDQPVSAADVLGALKEKQVAVNRTTVYRELMFLVEHDVVAEVRLVGKPSLFELADEHRHHLICVRCNRVKTIVMDNHLQAEEEKIMAEENFQISRHALEFYGLCPRCQQFYSE